MYQSINFGVIGVQETDLEKKMQLAKRHGFTHMEAGADEVTACGVEKVKALLQQYGAVSEPVAKAMAEGARRITGSSLALSVTGLAGPDGDDRGNPVGTVYIGLAKAGGTQVTQLFLKGDRKSIRQQAADYAFALLNKYLQKINP